jgi:hypothetical protein
VRIIVAYGSEGAGLYQHMKIAYVIINANRREGTARAVLEVCS